MAIDPIYLRLADVPEFAAEGGVEAALSSGRAPIAAAVRRARAQVDYDGVRELKQAALRGRLRALRARALARVQTPRAADVRRLRPSARPTGSTTTRCSARCAIASTAQPWWDWPDGLSTRQPSALAVARRSLERELRYPRLPAVARRRAVAGGPRGVAGCKLFGDLPFVVGADSADVWAHQETFARDLSVGTPPDAFSADGQDWGLPAYRWDVVERDDFSLAAGAGPARHRALRRLSRRSRDRLLPHLGAAMPRASAASRPQRPPSAAGARPARSCRCSRRPARRSSPRISAPCRMFLRESLLELGVPGYKVFRWERAWDRSTDNPSSIRAPTCRCR